MWYVDSDVHLIHIHDLKSPTEESKQEASQLDPAPGMPSKAGAERRKESKGEKKPTKKRAPKNNKKL
jgi:hypothetical protein